MKLKLSLLVTLSLIIFGTVGAAGADFTPIQVTSNSYDDTLPEVEGNCVVWQGHGNFSEATSTGADWEIFCYNTETKEARQITDNDYHDTSPQTDGTYVVWQGVKDGEWDIFLWDGEESLSISDRNAEDTCPQISSGLIVWDSEPFGEDFIGPGEIVLYDILTKTKTILSQEQEVDPDNTLDDGSPQINGTEVMWIQTDDEDNTRIFVYDHTTGVITQPSDYPWRDNPQADGSLTVLSRYVGDDREIFVYRNSLSTYEQITYNDLQDRYPRISGGNIVWMAAGEIFFVEYKYLALISPRDSVVLSKTSPPTFTWEGIGYDSFNVEFSEDPNFLTGNALTLAVGEETLLSETSFTPTEADWGAIRTIEQENGRAYWRVEGRASDGSVSFSETRSFTIQEDGVTATATTTGGSGASGGGDNGPCFIGTAAIGS